ncbi:DUF2971 domain-containing protein [Bacillus atrophaeus]|uniref:DUF2971 domain-containing protein n=1 Tax=Bacillus atrophaeus TaxID=1452 RepID=UPI0022827D42|nr:DUF2971 domain-containing protein [Bacillus atrophaeus]MCY8932519.1 DUF2971 domain-containing protein [Bacillus atrophaeus]MCY8942310.1 DUF2971 domain-containing protein [Bacillus atrophaeus]
MNSFNTMTDETMTDDQLNKLYKFLPHLNDNNIELLFHYTNINGLEGILKYNQFWVSHAHFLNDKTEINYTLNLSNEVFEEYCGNLSEEECWIFSNEGYKEKHDKEEIIEHLRDLYNVVVNDVFHQPRYRIYALSFCINSDSNLLWSNYSNNDGYSIQINYPKFKNYLKEKFKYKDYVHSGYVIYDKKVQKKLIEDLLKTLLGIVRNLLKPNLELEKVLLGVYSILSQYSIFFKDECFSQEEEFRIAMVFEDNFDDYSCRISNGAFIPYIEVHFEKDCVEGITVGPKNNMDITINGLKHFLKLNKYNDIQDEKILKSRIPYRY